MMCLYAYILIIMRMTRYELCARFTNRILKLHECLNKNSVFATSRVVIAVNKTKAISTIAKEDNAETVVIASIAKFVASDRYRTPTIQFYFPLLQILTK